MELLWNYQGTMEEIGTCKGACWEVLGYFEVRRDAQVG